MSEALMLRVVDRETARMGVSGPFWDVLGGRGSLAVESDSAAIAGVIQVIGGGPALVGDARVSIGHAITEPEAKTRAGTFAARFPAAGADAHRAGTRRHDGAVDVAQHRGAIRRHG